MALQTAQPADRRVRVRWVMSVIGLVIAFGLPELRLDQRLAPGTDLPAALLREAIWWGIGALLIGYVLLIEKRPLASIGIRRPTAKTVLIGVLAAIVLLATVVLSYDVIFPLLGLELNRAAAARITHNPVWLQTLLVVRAGVVEEILYRGYPMERIQELTGSKWFAALVAAAVFTYVHLGPWGAPQLIVVSFGAVILGLLYLWRRDLPCNMIAHALVDFISFVVAGAH